MNFVNADVSLVFEGRNKLGVYIHILRSVGQLHCRCCVKCQMTAFALDLESYFLHTIYGGELALLVGLGGLDFTSRLYWEKSALLPGLARLAKSPGLTTFIFSRNAESDICVQVFIL